jgi:hypothetical protein|eukprot:COSAG02_NODE_165_length_32175_cov_86.109490_31_plen_72_part_00
MMEAYETFHNHTYLEEAKIAADRLASDRGADEFFMTYELPMEAMGMLGLAKVCLILELVAYNYDCSQQSDR